VSNPFGTDETIVLRLMPKITFQAKDPARVPVIPKKLVNRNKSIVNPNPLEFVSPDKHAHYITYSDLIRKFIKITLKNPCYSTCG
jgi:hypothetical protein